MAVDSPKMIEIINRMKQSLNDEQLQQTFDEILNNKLKEVTLNASTLNLQQFSNLKWALEQNISVRKLIISGIVDESQRIVLDTLTRKDNGLSITYAPFVKSKKRKEPSKENEVPSSELLKAFAGSPSSDDFDPFDPFRYVTKRRPAKRQTLAQTAAAQDEDSLEYTEFFNDADEKIASEELKQRAEVAFTQSPSPVSVAEVTAQEKTLLQYQKFNKRAELQLALAKLYIKKGDLAKASAARQAAEKNLASTKQFKI